MTAGSVPKRRKAFAALNRFIAVAVVATIGMQIIYPLSSDRVQRVLTVSSVVTFFAASLSHAFATRGSRAALALVVVCVGGGLVAESVGWRTGVPFGNYRYLGSLGVSVAGVPLVVALAWAMMGWVALLSGRRVAARVAPSGGRAALSAVSVTGSAVLVTWDLFLDPQMVGSGHWSWSATPGPWLHGIPLVNSLGWFVVGTVMVGLLHLTVPVVSLVGRPDLPAWVMLGWTWFSETVGHIVFFGNPSVGVVGGLAMGAVLVLVYRPEALLRALPAVAHDGQRNMTGRET